MNFCIISPTAGLERYATRSKTHMVLAQQFLKDEAYTSFYLKRKDEGDFVMLDNGAYETAYEEAQFLDTLALLQPHVACLPDVIMKSAESTKASLDFLKKYEHQFPKTQWMFIPQGATLAGWRASLRCLHHFLEVAPVWIGLTRFLPTHVCKDDPLIRVKLATEIRSASSLIPIHCMGMADGDLNELRILAKQGYVRSIDSSAPVWRGWNGFGIGEGDRQAWHGFDHDVYFKTEVAPSKGGTYIEANLEAVLGFL